MSLHISEVVIEGNRLDIMPAIFEACSYRVVATPQVVEGGAKVSEALGDRSIGVSHVKKAAYVSGNWTHIVDAELVMMTEENFWLQLSRDKMTRVLCWVCEGVSGTYGFSLFEKGQKRRAILSVEGEITENFGDPLPEEVGKDFNQAFEDDVLDVASRLGAAYDYLEGNHQYQIYLLAGLQEETPLTIQSRPSNITKPKSWWHFW